LFFFFSAPPLPGFFTLSLHDALPICLVDEYFGQDTGLRDAPGGRSLMRWGMRALSTVGFGVGVTADTIYNQAIQMANQFIVGAGTKEALPVVADLWKRGMAHSVDLLGEATVCEAEAET